MHLEVNKEVGKLCFRYKKARQENNCIVFTVSFCLADDS
jgi:hypothetical protein